ncbi:MAG: iron ABC transporter permease [bacterium]|nr:iron ABC transporter permease [bacterium]
MATFDTVHESANIIPDVRPFAVRRFPLFLALSLGVIALLIVLHIAVGTLDFSPVQIVKALVDQAEDPLHRQVVWGLRLPRALVAIVAGAMLGLAGAILQTVTRNPLAEPGLMGVSSGGVLAIVIYIVFGAGVSADSGLILPLVGLIGGMTAATLTYLLSYSNGTDPIRLVLTGVLVAGMCSAFTSLLLLWADDYQVQRIIRWTVGSTSGRVWVHWETLYPIALIAIPIGLVSAGLANVLQLGDSVARGIGQRVELARLFLLFAASLLTAGAVAVVGAVGFIGLIGPHMARRIVGGDVRRLFPMSVILTAALLIGSDILARTLTIGWIGIITGLDIPDTAGLPVGAVTALLGAPFFLVLLLRRKHAL